MPADFMACVKSGGKVRTLDIGKDSYMHVCYKGGKATKGEVMKKKMKKSMSKYAEGLAKK